MENPLSDFKGNYEESKESLIKENLLYSPAEENTETDLSRIQQYRDLHAVASVCNPIIKEGTFKKYVIYTIKGSDSTGIFEVARRYKEFRALRQLLVRNWPGCYIPQLPGKQASGNFLPNFIEQRRKLLDLFICKLISLPYFYRSEEFQTFIRGGSSDYKKLAGDCKKYDYNEISENYQAVFREFLSQKVTDEDERNLEKLLSTFEDGLENLQKFENSCKISVDYFGIYDKELSGLIQGIKNVNKLYANGFGGREINVEIRDTYTNPFYILLDWARAEILDQQSIIEAIQKKSEFKKILDKAEGNFDSEKQKLQKMHTGRKPISQIFSSKSKQDHIKNAESNHQYLEKELQSIAMINKIISLLLIRREIPRFKQQKASRYETMMRNFACAECQEFEYIVSQALQIQDCLNVTDLSQQ
ncbi:unnamed protein product [Blepharisma stoltei]|uniref:PX domain-containing protein n=1 Tax=Blepharisma stoltei TaxID=1481888 RepID=A0AAU9IUL2_9CILI|nr:unnamed protein product [Blepharisma stoltei]